MECSKISFCVMAFFGWGGVGVEEGGKKEEGAEGNDGI